jgi:hypothetical protein
MKKILLASSFLFALVAVRSQSHRIVVHLDSSAKKPLSGWSEAFTKRIQQEIDAHIQ